MERHIAVGVMSGTSLDGVDLACCTFAVNEDKYAFSIDACITVPYDAAWRKKLSDLSQQDGMTFARINTEYGHYLGQLVKTFVRTNGLHPALVASHGHTIFHQPENGFTSQVGDGASLAAECGLPVVCDFRTSDVAYGGQGAPLVPIGDRLLFGNYSCCLNLGGFGNISFEQNGKRIAFDTCPVNIVLDLLANRAGYDYDNRGNLASVGRLLPELLEQMNCLPYYHREPPKSLGREWLETEFLPLLPSSQVAVNDILATMCEHIAFQVVACIPAGAVDMIITGGGALNQHLVSRIAGQTKTKLIIPSPDIINYKEALIFALLGLLRIEGKPNCIPSVTGASKAAVGGAVYLP